MSLFFSQMDSKPGLSQDFTTYNNSTKPSCLKGSILGAVLNDTLNDSILGTFRELRESNLGQLDKKSKCYLCAIESPTTAQQTIILCWQVLRRY